MKFHGKKKIGRYNMTQTVLYPSLCLQEMKCVIKGL